MAFATFTAQLFEIPNFLDFFSFDAHSELSTQPVLKCWDCLLWSVRLSLSNLTSSASWDSRGLVKVSKSQKQNCQKKLLPKTNGQICFSILTVRNYLKLEISISSFKYFRTVRNQDRKTNSSVRFWKKFFSTILLLRFIDL